MGFHHNPDSVISGLVFAVDAANSKSYTSIAAPWRDLTRNKYSMTFANSPTYSSANRGSIVFDGVNDTCTANEDFANNLTAMTVCAWVKTSAAVSSVYPVPIVTKCAVYEPAAAEGAGWMLLLRNNGSTSLTFLIQNGNATLYNEAVASFSVTNDGLWHHVAAVLYTFEAQIDLYQDGQLLITSISGTGGISTISTTTKVRIGSTIGSGFFNGSVSGVQIYNRDLTASEIKQNFNAARGRYGV